MSKTVFMPLKEESVAPSCCLEPPWRDQETRGLNWSVSGLIDSYSWWQIVPVKVPAEALAEQVKGKRVNAGRREAEDSGQQCDDEVSQRQIHLIVVEGAVQVEQVVGEPAEGEQANEHQHDLRQALPRLHLQEQRLQTLREINQLDGLQISTVFQIV